MSIDDLNPDFLRVCKRRGAKLEFEQDDLILHYNGHDINLGVPPIDPNDESGWRIFLLTNQLALRLAGFSEE